MDELDMMADKANEKTKAMAGRMAPPAGDIQPSTYTAFKEVVGEAIELFSDGQVDAEMGDEPEGGGVSPACSRNTMALAALFQKLPEGKPYQFDVDAALGTDAGMSEATAAIGRAMKDQRLVRAAQAPAKPAGPPPAAKASPAPKKPSAKDPEFYTGE